MTEQEINVAIAKACGWDRFCIHEVLGEDVIYGYPPDSSNQYEQFIPNYCNDLNAMQEALSTLKEKDWDVFESKLGWITGDRGFCKINATAKQKAEAFLQTLGIYKKNLTFPTKTSNI